MRHNNLLWKWAICRLLFPLLIFAVGMTKGYAYDFSAVCATGQTLYYNITDATNHYVQLTCPTSDGWSGYTQPTGDITLPSSVDYNGVTYTITSIGERAFYSCRNLTGSLTIPNSVTTIGNDAFYYCYGFTGSLIIPNSVTTIGNNAFRFCMYFTGSLIIPNSVITIGNQAFYYCQGFTGSLIIPNSVTTIGNEAFCSCSGFTGSLTISNSVTTIGDEVFSRCSGFTGDLVIPNSVIEIGWNAFSYCSGFTGCLTIGNSVTTISSAAFAGCTGIEAIVVASGNPNYDSRGNCNAIIETSTNTLVSGCKNSLIPNSVVTIGDNAFSGCSSLTGSLIIPNSVTTIGNGAFSGCSGLTGSLTIGSSVNIIGDWAFNGCSGFTGSLSIPNSVTTIGSSAFYGCSGFTGGLTIPNSLTMIDWEVFSGCSGFTGSLTIPNSVTEINYQAFYGCSGFTGNLNIPNSVTSIASSAFSGCSGFDAISVGAGNPNYDSRGNCNAIIETNSNTLVFGCKNSYIPNSVTAIGERAFYNCSGLTGSLTIPNSVTTIGSSAFYNCSGLTGSLTIPNSVTTIGSSAFYNCSGLTGSLTIPNSVTLIGMNAFSGCSGFTGSLTLSNSLTYIDYEVFSRCSGFTGSLTIPNSVTSIRRSAFAYCTGFTGELTIPNSVTSIGYLSFYGCSGITAITSLAETPPSLDNYAFYGMNHGILITVPCGALNAYQSASGWSDFAYIYEDCGTTYSIFLCAHPTEGGVIEGGGEYEYGDECTVIAMANEGYSFTCWSENGTVVSTSDTLSFTVTESRVLVANFTLPIELHVYAEYYPDVNDEQSPYIRIFWGEESFCEGFSYDFDDSALPDGWTIIDGGSPSGYGWKLASLKLGSGFGHNGSNDCFISQSYDNNYGAIYPDNYLISEQVDITEGSTFSFWACAQDLSYSSEHFGVFVSLGSNSNPDDFQEVQSWTLSPLRSGEPLEGRVIRGGNRVQTLWHQYTVDLSDFVGTGYIAIRHYNCYDQYMLVVDDVEFCNGPQQANRTLYNYNVYRANCDGTDVTLIAENVTETEYIDSTWMDLAVGNYKYGIHIGETAWSNCIEKTYYNITATANLAEGGTITGDGNYIEGQTCTLTATANAGYTFVNWTENGEVVSTEATYTFTVTGNRDLVANFIANGGGEHEYVDLGLPSGTLWATCNVGADTPEGYGDYFAWGETEPKDSYDWNNYQYCNGVYYSLTKYCSEPYFGYNNFTDTLTILLPEDDAATANWGDSWRMPTKEEWQELYNNTIVIWTTQNGVSGCLLTANNGVSLFLPAAGFYYSENDLLNADIEGYYWSSSLSTVGSTRSWYFNFDGGDFELLYNFRNSGQSVRAVRSPMFIIDVTANPTEGGEITGGGDYQGGVDCTLTATANEDYTFVNWTENGEVVSTENPYTFTVIGNRSLVANFVNNIPPMPNNLQVFVEHYPDTTNVFSPYVRVYWNDGIPCDGFSYDFDDSALPDGWITIDGGNPSGYGWILASQRMGLGFGHNGSNDCFMSESADFNGVAIHPDNYLVSEQVNITEGSTFSFWACAYQYYISEHFGVFVSLGSNDNPDDFQEVQSWTMTVSRSEEFVEGMTSNGQSTWRYYSVDLSDFVGTGYIAIRHYDCYDQFYLAVDDVEFCNGPQQANRSFYNVYRANCDGTDVTLIAENVTETEYIDSTWMDLTVGNFKYGVSIVSGRGNVSEIHWNNSPVSSNHHTIDASAFLNPVTNSDYIGDPSRVNYDNGWIYYDDGSYAASVGTGGGAVYWGIRFPAADLAAYDGQSLTKVAVFTNVDGDYGWTYSGTYTASVYQGGASAPGTLMSSASEYLPGDLAWHDITLATPVTIDATQDLWLTFYTADIAYPMSGCDYVGNSNSDLLSLDGVTWEHAASGYGLNYTWMIRGLVEGGGITWSNCIEKPNGYFVSAIANPLEGGVIMGSGNYYEGETCTLTATPNEGYQFLYWTEDEDVVSMEATYSFTVTDNRTLVANFVAYNPSGDLQVFAEYYPDSSNVFSPYVKVYWTGITASRYNIYRAFCYSDDYELIAENVTDTLYIDYAWFNLPLGNYKYGVSVEDGRGGTGQIHWNDAPVATNEILIDASTFGNPTANNGSLEMPLRVNYDNGWLHYDNGNYIKSIGSGLGMLHWGVKFPSETLASYAGNQLKKVAVYMRSGNNEILNISVHVGGTIAPGMSVWSMDFDVSGYNNGFVEFALPEPIFITGTENIWITLSQAGNYPAQASPDSGEPNSRWISLNGQTWMDMANYGLDGSWMIRGYVGDDPAIYWSNCIDKTHYNITAMANPSDGGSVSGAGIYSQGTTCTLTATANSGYHFANWTENGVVVSTSANYSFTVTRSRNLVAHFTTNSQVCAINVSTNPSYGGSANGGGYYYYGTICTVTASANSGYIFTNWTENGTVVSIDASYTFTVTGSRNLVANFTAIPQFCSINVYANPSYGGSVTGTGTYAYGINCTLTATATTGYIFLNWTENGTVVSTSANYSFTVTRNRNLVANFTVNLPYYGINAVPNPDEGGTITGTGIYMEGQNCTLKAFANSGYTFINWTKDGDIVSTNATYSFVVTETANYVANFELRSYAITVTASPTEGGSVTGAGSYYYGATCTVTATANSGYFFANWTLNGRVVSYSAEYIFTVTGNRNLVANFVTNPQVCTISTFTNPSYGGTAIGAGYYYTGASCTLTATANSGYAFVNWTENNVVVSTDDEYTFTVTGNRNLAANFTPVGTISAIANPSYGGSITGGGTYQYGTSCTLRATANNGYLFVNWTENGVTVSTNTNYTFTVTGNRNLVANFAVNPQVYMISIFSNPSYGGTVTGGGTYFYGENCTVHATPNGGYTFVNWTVNGTVVSYNADYTFTVTDNRTLLANFMADTQVYTINVSANPSYGGTVSGAGSFYSGSSCTVTASANNGYSFVNWTENGTVVSFNANYTFTVTRNRNLVANFSANMEYYGINATPNPTEGGTITGAGVYIEGQTCTLTASPSFGYVFVNWSENGTVVSFDASYTFTVTGNRNLVANFADDMSFVGINANPNPIEGGAIMGAGLYLPGQTCILTAMANRGYTFVNWTENGTVVSNNNEYSFIVTGSRNLLANFDIQPTVTQTSNFSQGYNWWSTYIEQDGINGLQMLQNSLGGNGVSIRSQADGYVDYYSYYGWYGSLSSINNESSYRIVTNSPCSITLTGIEAVPSQHPITLSQGWTWIGYVPSTAMDVNSAMEGIDAVVGDKLKSQQGYADFYEGYGWYGSLNTIEPGMGLMYYSTNDEPVTFTYPDSSRGGELQKNITSENNHWLPDPYAWPTNMTMLAVIDLNGEEIQSEDYELAAFDVNGECRGSIRTMYVDITDRYYAFMTISGDVPVELHFGLYDWESHEECFEVDETLMFKADTAIGTIFDPMVLHFRGLDNVKELDSRVEVFPNPVNRGTSFSINMAGDVNNFVRVEIVNAMGVVVEAVHAPSVQTFIAPSVAGIYTLRITEREKGTIIRKLIVK